MKPKIYPTLKAGFEEIAEQGYKHCNLCEIDGTKIVNFNTIKFPIKDKLKEIEKRWKNLPDGVYVMQCRALYGNRAQMFPVYVGKGEYDGNITTEKHIIPAISERKEKTENVLSYDAALANIKEIEKLKGEKQMLENQIQNLKTEIVDLTEQLAESETEEEQDGLTVLSEKTGTWLKEIMPSFVPIVDRYFDLENKKLDFTKARFLHESGYDLAAPNGKQRNGNGKARPREIDFHKEIPEPGTKHWKEYIDFIMALPDEEFNAHLDALKKTDMTIYDAVEAEVLEDDNTNEE